MSYYECLYKIETQAPLGYCMSSNEITGLTPSFGTLINFTNLHQKNQLNSRHFKANKPTECCSQNDTMSNFCFQWLPLSSDTTQVIEV